jgi:hypothetical protein
MWNISFLIFIVVYLVFGLIGWIDCSLRFFSGHY